MKPAPTRSTFVIRYLSLAIPAHLIWEIAQLPLYTLWEAGSPRATFFAVVHCTAGDIAIALCALAIAVIAFGNPGWPGRRDRGVAAATMLSGIAYTVFSEWLNTEVRGAWAYTSLMPLVPPLGTGLSPLLQWVVVPAMSLWWARRGTAHLPP